VQRVGEVKAPEDSLLFPCFCLVVLRLFFFVVAASGLPPSSMFLSDVIIVTQISGKHIGCSF
jgi:hypothetical protein